MARNPGARCARRLLIAAIAAAVVVLGPAAASAAAAGAVNNFPPEMSQTEPLVSGPERLVCGSGSWTGGSPQFEYEFIREGITVQGRKAGAIGGNVYITKPADTGGQIWCVVWAEKTGPAAESWNSVQADPGSPAKEPPPKELPPEAKSPPEPPQVSPASAEPGQVLTCSQGGWENNPTSYSYIWLKQKSGGAKEAISGANSSSFTVVPEDEGYKLWCKVTAKNGAGEATAESSTGATISGKAPVNRVLPHIAGQDQVGQLLTCNEGEWTGSKPLTFAFKWYVNSTEISGATASTYTVPAGDEGKKLLCEVVATNSQGKGSASSLPVTIEVKPPENVKPPVVSGKPEVGKTLGCSTGTWTGSPTSYEYQWWRDEGGTEIELSSKTSNYTVVEADVGNALLCAVTATNAGGSTTRVSEPVVVAKAGTPPKNLSRPEVSGTPTPGHELTCSQGTWSGNPSQFTYQWVRDKGSSEEDVLELGTSSRYSVVSADAGQKLTCDVTAISSEGKGEAASLEVRVSGIKPHATYPPEVVGGSHVGEVLTCVRGEWEAQPKPTFAYKWFRAGAEIKGAAASTYTIQAEDRGFHLSCVVTATNIEGSGEAESASVRIPGEPPIPTKEPVIEGNAAPGETLTCGKSEWSGAPTPSLKYQWLIGGVAVDDQTTEFKVSSAQRGLQVECEVIAENTEGKASGFASVRIPGKAPEPLVFPRVTGAPALGQTLTCEPGIWEGKPPPVFRYQWMRDGAALPGATAGTYVVEPADQGHLLSCNVTAINTEGRVEVESEHNAAIPERVVTSSTTQSGGSTTVTPETEPTAEQILRALGTQLVRAFAAPRLSTIAKSGGYSFSLVGPTLGTAAVEWYEFVKGANGKIVKLIVAEGKTVYTKRLVKQNVRLRLTAKGRKALAHKKQLTLRAKVTFTAPHGVKVNWLDPILLKH